MYGLKEVFTLYNVRFEDIGNKLTAYTKGGIAILDQKKLLANGWVKINDQQFYHLIEPKIIPTEDYNKEI